MEKKKIGNCYFSSGVYDMYIHQGLYYGNPLKAGRLLLPQSHGTAWKFITVRMQQKNGDKLTFFLLF